MSGRKKVNVNLSTESRDKTIEFDKTLIGITDPKEALRYSKFFSDVVYDEADVFFVFPEAMLFINAKEKFDKSKKRGPRDQNYEPDPENIIGYTCTYIVPGTEKGGKIPEEFQTVNDFGLAMNRVLREKAEEIVKTPESRKSSKLPVMTLQLLQSTKTGVRPFYDYPIEQVGKKDDKEWQPNRSKAKRFAKMDIKEGPGMKLIHNGKTSPFKPAEFASKDAPRIRGKIVVSVRVYWGQHGDALMFGMSAKGTVVEGRFSIMPSRLVPDAPIFGDAEEVNEEEENGESIRASRSWASEGEEEERKEKHKKKELELFKSGKKEEKKKESDEEEESEEDPVPKKNKKKKGKAKKESEDEKPSKKKGKKPKKEESDDETKPSEEEQESSDEKPKKKKGDKGKKKKKPASDVDSD